MGNSYHVPVMPGDVPAEASTIIMVNRVRESVNHDSRLATACALSFVLLQGSRGIT